MQADPPPDAAAIAVEDFPGLLADITDAGEAFESRSRKDRLRSFSVMGMAGG